jgi:hypothetical protein
MKGHLNIHAATSQLKFGHCRYACNHHTSDSRLVDYAVTQMQFAKLLSAFPAYIERKAC